ncbi:zinc-binding protein A33-like [Pantherophis guttatus]|uniref:Zinc-binding protein A33-like n=1 Tax=Pantherophis guttatus TaxID=94885 RepID=A0ABM3ZMQ3_PANGU|nr:zinc-binding protein A33-like [Pantherophis guttatus]
MGFMGVHSIGGPSLKETLLHEFRDVFEETLALLREEDDQLKTKVDQLKTKVAVLREEDDQLTSKVARLREEDEFQLQVTHSCKADLTLDPKTANPRLEVSKDRKRVRDTGNICHVSKSKQRFESYTFVLAEQGFSEGSYYWEVEVGQKNMWDVGVASESAPRTGRITLSPQNGYWVIGRDNRKNYWARTDPSTHLNIADKLTRIGIFLNLKSQEISFYDAQRQHKIYTFLHVASGKFYPFFSTGPLTGGEFDNGELIIPPLFGEKEIVKEK